MSADTAADSLVVPARFNGPPRSGNGGWTAGAVAHLLDPGHSGPVTVTLRMPPPLDVALRLERDGDVLAATHDGATVATARPADHAPPPIDAVTLAEAREAEATFVAPDLHPFTTCVGCGPDRAVDDGLRILPGRLDATRVAGTWTPHAAHGRVEGLDADGAWTAAAWTAIDCIGGWAGGQGERLLVLGTMTAEVHRLPRAGETLVVLGEHRGGAGRKAFSGAALLDADGAPVATAEHVWLEVDPAAFA